MEIKGQHKKIKLLYSQVTPELVSFHFCQGPNHRPIRCYSFKSLSIWLFQTLLKQKGLVSIKVLVFSIAKHKPKIFQWKFAISLCPNQELCFTCKDLIFFLSSNSAVSLYHLLILLLTILKHWYLLRLQENKHYQYL